MEGGEGRHSGRNRAQETAPSVQSWETFLEVLVLRSGPLLKAYFTSEAFILFKIEVILV